VGSQRSPQTLEQDNEFLQNFNNEPFIGADEEFLTERERFRKFAKKKEEVESTSDLFKRNIGQHAARVYETLAGFPGNLKKAFLQTRDFLESSRPEGNKLSQLEEEALGTPRVESLEHRLMNLPTSGELREIVTPTIAEKLGKERSYFEPRGKVEEVAGELTQDLTAMFQPGTGQLRMLTRIGAPIAGNLIEHGIKFLGGDEKTAEQAKYGMMLATTIAGQANPAQYARERIAQSKEMIPANFTVANRPLIQRLGDLYHRMRSGFGVPSKSKALAGMEDILQQSQNGRLPMQTLMQMRDDINEWIAEAGGFDVPAVVRDRQIANLNELKREVINTIDTNLSERFPEAGELYRTGYEAAAVTHQSNAITNFIEKNFGKRFTSVGAKVLFPAIGGAAFLSKTATAAAGAYPIYKTGQVLYRVGNSPTLAAYYGEVLRSAAQGNVPAMVKSLSRLDKELRKQEEKEEKKNSKEKKSLEHFKSRFTERD